MKNFSLKKHVAHVHEEQKHTCAKYAAVENSCKHWSTWRTCSFGNHQWFYMHFEGSWRLIISSYVLNENNLILLFYSQIKPLFKFSIIFLFTPVRLFRQFIFSRLRSLLRCFKVVEFVEVFNIERVNFDIDIRYSHLDIAEVDGLV